MKNEELKIMTAEMKFVQQGDVLIKRLDGELPTNLVKYTKDKVVQQSETQGNSHKFANYADVEIYRSSEISDENGVTRITEDEGTYLVVNEPSVLYHGKGFEINPAKTTGDGHVGIEIPPGKYMIDIRREYDYEANEVMRVVD